MSDSIRRTAVAALTAILVGVVGWGLITGEPAEADRVEALGARIKCPVCQGESIAESPSTYAQDLMIFVADKVAEGWTDEEIVVYLEDRFAGIRLDPAFSGLTAVLWLLPLAALAAGVSLARGRMTRSGASP